MRRELQVEPLILCLVQPAPSGTRAYIPKMTDDNNSPNRNRNNYNHPKKSNNNTVSHSNTSKDLHKQKDPKVIKDSSVNTDNEESFEGRTRRRRSTMQS